MGVFLCEFYARLLTLTLHVHVYTSELHTTTSDHAHSVAPADVTPQSLTAHTRSHQLMLLYCAIKR